MNTKQVRVRVTKNDIREAAKEYDYTSCPIARSLKRICDVDRVVVHDKACDSVFVLEKGYKRYTGVLPTWAKRFVTWFDKLATSSGSAKEVQHMRPRRKSMALPVDFLKNKDRKR